MTAARTPLARLSRAVTSIVAIAVGLANGLLAGEPPSPGWQRLERYSLNYAYPGSQLKDHVYTRSARHFALGDAARDALQSADAVRARQIAIRQFILESIGGLPPSDTPLNARTTGTIAGNGFTIEKVIFEARPRHYVTANLYLPATRSGPTGAVLFLCGHHTTAKQVAEYQNVCQTLVQAGLAVFAMDPVGQGERLSYFDPETKRALVRAGTGEHEYAGVQTRFIGDQIARYFLHDAMRSIDYLLTRPEIDPARIGVTGNSGGGTQTSLVMMADPRIAAAAPATFIMSREAYQWTGQGQDAEQNWFGFTRAGFDHEDILLAMAPKPVLVLAVTSDFFPIEGTRRTVSRARRIWDLHGRADALALVEDDSTHRYTPALAHAAADFFAHHLLGRPRETADRSPPRERRDTAPAEQTPLPALTRSATPEERTFGPSPFSEQQLWATQSGQVRGDFPDAEFVFEANLARLDILESSRRNVPAAARAAHARAWLREQVFRDRDASELNLRRVERGTVLDDLLVDIGFWYSQPRLASLGMLFRPRSHSGALPVTIALWDDGTQALSRHAAWIRAECGRGRAVLVLNVAGVGPLKPDSANSRTGDTEGTFRKLVDDLSFIGDSLVALRTWETLRALDVLKQWPGVTPGGVHVYAHGRLGMHGKLAAALDPRIARCEWHESFRFTDFVRNRSYDATNIKSVILPGALRYFDLDEL